VGATVNGAAARAGIRLAGRCGVLAALLLALGLTALPTLPGPDADGQQVFAFFLDSGTGLRLGAASIIVGLLLIAVLFAALNRLLWDAGADVIGAGMLALSLVAVGAQALAAATLISLAAGSEDADPSTSRELLDLADTAIGISGPAFAGALLAFA